MSACDQCGTAISSAGARSRAGSAPEAVPETGVDSTWGPVVARLREALANEFEIDGELGRGGMAAVFRGRELALNRRVAIKVMAPGLLLGEGMVERFRQEAITVANLQHANIVAVHGVRTVDDLHLFVMQYVPGRSLDRVLRDHGRISVDAIRTILYHVGSALDYAHRRGVIHRDIKPGNILLDADGDPVVTDFGIAKVAETTGYTHVGTVIGTPAYMSPEQCLGHEVTPASDQYALGIVAYEMLTGKTPFAGGSLAVMRAHTDETPPPLRAARPDVPDAIEAAVTRMLAKRPEDRFPDLAAAIEAVDAQPLSSLGPVRAEMSALAGAASSETRLADLVRAPRSPVPSSRVTPPARSADGQADSNASPPAPLPPTSGERATATPRPPRLRVASIRLAGLARDIEVGDCVVLDASARSDTGDRVDGARIRWESSNDVALSVDSAGVLTAHAPGTATVTASCGDVRAAIDVVAVPAEAATIEVTAPAEVRAGTRATLAARALDRHGNVVDAPIAWTSRNPSVATVDPDGALTARRRGVAVVVAEAGGIARAVTIDVRAAPVVEVVVSGVPSALVVGATATLRAIVRVARSAGDENGHDVRWRSSDPMVASVSSEGVVTARAIGQVTITATCEGVSGSAPLAVVNVRAATVVLASPPSPLRLGDTVALRATVCDAGGDPVARPVTWRTTDARVADVDQQGRVTARGEGWAIVTAAADGVDAHAEVVVRQHVIPVSAAGRRESRRLALRWLILLAVVAGALLIGWKVLLR